MIATLPPRDFLCRNPGCTKKAVKWLFLVQRLTATSSGRMRNPALRVAGKGNTSALVFYDVGDTAVVAILLAIAVG